jgi:hypothetical protein
MGPEAAKSFPGQQLVRTASATEQSSPAARARQEIDYGRRGKGYIFGAFRPGTGEAFTQPYTGRTIANWVDFLERVDTWVPQKAEPVYVILDNLSASPKSLLCCNPVAERRIDIRGLQSLEHEVNGPDAQHRFA